MSEPTYFYLLPLATAVGPNDRLVLVKDAGTNPVDSVALIGQAGGLALHDHLVSLSATADGSVLTRLLGTASVTIAKLAQDVISVLQSGLDPAKYQGLWTPATDTPTIPAAAGGNSGNWYFVAAAGTATGNAAGTYAYGDAIVSNGAAWLLRPAPPTVIPPESVTLDKLDPVIQSLIARVLSDVTIRPTFTASHDGLLFVVAVGDKQIASINQAGELTVLLGDATVKENAYGLASVPYLALKDEVKQRVARSTFNGDGRVAEIGIGGKVVVWFDNTGAAYLKFQAGVIAELAAALDPYFSPRPKKTFMSGRLFEIGIGGKVVFGITPAGNVSPGGGVPIGGDANTYGFPNHTNWGRWHLRDWNRLALERLLGTSTVIDVLCIGDSWTWNGNIWLTYISRQLKALLGDAGPGFISFSSTAPGSSTTIGSFADSNDGSASKIGSWSIPTTFAGRGPDIGEATSSTIGDKITLTCAAVCSAVRLKYLKKVSGGLLRYRFNAGAWTTIDTDDVADALGDDALTGVPVSAPWTLEVEVESGSVTVFGADCQKTGPGIRFHKAGHSGSRSTHFAAANALWETSIASLSPKMVIMGWGTNDQALPVTTDAFIAAEETVCDRIRSVRAGMDILLWAPAENLAGRATPITQYRDAAYRVAASKRCAFIDLARLFGEATTEYDDSAPRVLFIASNALHPTEAGNKLAASEFLKVLKP